MQIRVGYELIYDCQQRIPMILTLKIHHTRLMDIVVPDHLRTDPSVPVAGYRDGFGNWCSRIVVPPGRIRVTADAIVNDTGQPDAVAPSAQQIPVEDLPEKTLVFLLHSRYCETDRLSEAAWDLFGNSPPGWGRVQAASLKTDCTQVMNAARSLMTQWLHVPGTRRLRRKAAPAVSRGVDPPAPGPFGLRLLRDGRSPLREGRTRVRTPVRPRG